jgi:hypothetical protein
MSSVRAPFFILELVAMKINLKYITNFIPIYGSELRVYAFAYIYIHMYIYVYMYMYLYICTYTYICIHIYES